MEDNIWNDALGPFYTEESLAKRGVSAEGLISITSTDGIKIYPNAQFSVLEDGTPVPRMNVLELWYELIQPAIDEGAVDEWSATVLLLQKFESGPSGADVISNDESQTQKVAAFITQTLGRWRQ